MTSFFLYKLETFKDAYLDDLFLIMPGPGCEPGPF
jgi:hypothetical protein